MWIISIDLLARQVARQTPIPSKNVCCGCQRSIDNSTFFIFFSNTKNNNDGLYSHKSCTLETPPEADCGLFPSIYWRARWRARRRPRQKMSAVDPSVASTIPLFVIIFCTSPELIYDARTHARCRLEPAKRVARRGPNPTVL